MTERTLIRGATIVTMDRNSGVLPEGDILVQDGRIAAIATSLQADDCAVVDAGGFIAMPGLINAHMHTWQTGLRAVAANWTLLEYFRWVHAGLATRFRPEDIHVATLAGALNQLDGGTTTLVDWCHNNPTPAHTDAAVQGLQEAGIRAAFFHGSPKPDPKPGEPHFSEVPHPRREVERLLSGPFAASDQLLSLGLALLGPHYATTEVCLHDFRLAREYRLVASMHQGGGTARSPDGWDRLEQAGLLGPWVNIVHGNDLTDQRLRRFVDSGVSFSATPGSEMLQGHGHPITGRLRVLGAAPSLGVDLESIMAGDMFSVARLAYSHQRALDNAAHRAATGAIPETGTIRAREALAWITAEGARMLGMDDRIGSLAPGKQADLILLRATDLGFGPVHDPIASVAMQAGPQHVDSVMVGGIWRKRNGRLLVGNLEVIKKRLAESGRRILRELGWTVNA